MKNIKKAIIEKLAKAVFESNDIVTILLEANESRKKEVTELSKRIEELESVVDSLASFQNETNDTLEHLKWYDFDDIEDKANEAVDSDRVVELFEDKASDLIREAIGGCLKDIAESLCNIY